MTPQPIHGTPDEAVAATDLFYGLRKGSAYSPKQVAACLLEHVALPAPG